MRWWIQEASSYNGWPLQISHWDLTIESDAFKQGWGASCQGTNTGGPWTATEQSEHINYLEMKAAFLALQSFYTGRSSLSVLLLMDSVTAIAFLNKMGGNHSHSLSDLAKKVWMWCIKRKLTIHAEHLPGSGNIRAEPTPYKFQRLEITQGDFRKSRQETGCLLNRFVCLQDKHPIATVLQLEARSRSTGYGYPVNIIGKPPSLHVSPICTDSSLLDQASQRENISSNYSSCVA